MLNSNAAISTASESVPCKKIVRFVLYELNFMSVVHCLDPIYGSYTPCNRNLAFSLTSPSKASNIAKPFADLIRRADSQTRVMVQDRRFLMYHVVVTLSHRLGLRRNPFRKI